MIRSGESLRSVLFNMSYISDRCLRKEKERNVKIQQVVFWVLRLGQCALTTWSATTGQITGSSLRHQWHDMICPMFENICLWCLLPCPMMESDELVRGAHSEWPETADQNTWWAPAASGGADNASALQRWCRPLVSPSIADHDSMNGPVLSRIFWEVVITIIILYIFGYILVERELTNIQKSRARSFLYVRVLRVSLMHVSCLTWKTWMSTLPGNFE